MNKKKLLFSGVICFLTMVSCKTTEFGFKTVDINGMVYDFANRPVANCEILLGGMHKSSTDINGRFALLKVPLGTHLLTGSKKGFENYSDEAVIKDRRQIIYIRLPSQNQLLALVEEALTANNLILAEEAAKRAYQIDDKNAETLFYYAAVKFRQNDFDIAINILETAWDIGTKDPYIEKFLILLKEMKNAEQ